MYGLGLVDDIFEQSLREDHAVLRVTPESVGAHLDLLDALFTRDIERAERRAMERYLQRKGRLADAGLAANEHERTGDDAAAEQAVDLGAAEAHAGLGRGVDLAKADGLAAFGRTE